MLAQETVRASALDEVLAALRHLSGREVAVGRAPLAIHKRPEGEGRWRVEVRGEAPAEGAWWILARLEHREGERPEVRWFGEPRERARWNRATPWCSHCRTVRRRRITYLLVSGDQPEVHQVGSSCVADFLGRDPSAVIQRAEAVAEADRALRRAAPSGREPEGIDALEFLGCVCAARRTRGRFVGKREARRLGAEPTYSSAMALLRSGGRPNQEDRAEAAEALRWVRAELGEDLGEDRRGFRWRVVELLRTKESLPDEQLPLAAQAVALHDAKQAERGAAEWVGERGERVELEVVVEQLRPSKPNRFGEVFCHVFADDRGHRLVWFASGGVRLEPGRRYRLRGRVRRHGRWGGKAETVLERVRAEPSGGTAEGVSGR